MCGIVGRINFNEEKVDESCVKEMMSLMKHRGPDDEGEYFDNNVGLGFVRLSILDLSPDGHQPMFSSDGNLVMIYNGEVYNYIELRSELESRHTFKSGTDTEVVLAAYQEWGEDCLERFNGMFAFAIYNIKEKTLFAARDRFGVKPFYYYLDEDKFLFASEVKSLLPFIELKANESIISDYLLFNRTDHSEETFFLGVRKLQHGTFLTIDKGEINFSKWYNLADKISVDQKIITPEEYRKLFSDAVKIRLRADVPIGVSLSGGIDSSAITSVLIEDHGVKDLNTFSAVYSSNEPSDESSYINEYNGIVDNMHFTTPDEETFFNDFSEFIEAHSEPCPDVGPYIQYKVMELANKHVTVTLDGQGADEQLAGYHNFFSIYHLELIKKMRLFSHLLENYYFLKNQGLGKMILNLKYFTYYVAPSRLQQFFSKKKHPSISKSFYKKNDKNFEVNRMLYNPKTLNDSLVQHFEYKLEHLLRWEDLNAMHFSIESRVPFMDYRLVEATISTPPNQKINKGETKVILREAVKDILPKRILERKDKKGFSNPRESWLKSDKMQHYIFELIQSEQFIKRGIFDSAIAIKQYKKHINGEVDASQEIWKWINLEVWYRKFID